MIASRSGHIDSFARDNLPPREQWPTLAYQLPELGYAERLNCVTELLDRWIVQGHGARPCLISDSETLTYSELAERVNRIANVLIRDLKMVPGNRVLLRGPNGPMFAAAFLAVLKAGGVAVATMPLLRAKELGYSIEKAKIDFALCDARLTDELGKAPGNLSRILYWGARAPGSLDTLMAQAGYENFAACDTSADDVCMIAFTSGTTGIPKGTMHFHRDLLAICDTYGKYILDAKQADVFIGSPPLAFTFGLGGLLLFPLRIGASTVLLERASPSDLVVAIGRFGATVCFTAPTAYRAMIGLAAENNISTLRKCVSAGETLPKATFEAWRAATGLTLLDGLGTTELLHIFIGCREGDARPGATGKAVPGYEVRIIDEKGMDVPSGKIGRLAVRGPTGCRYLADARQQQYVEDGWNVTGDTYLVDDDGYFVYQARSDDMIVSAGYNIAGPEVEAALLLHPAVAECGVVSMPDEDRGQIPKAYVVLDRSWQPDAALVRILQDHVKASIAPYKYPRAIEFVASLPRTQNGKLQRFELRRAAAESVAPLDGSVGEHVVRHSQVQKQDATKGHAVLLPDGWPRPSGYSNGIAARGEMVFVGGMIGADTNNRVADGFVAQAKLALENIVSVLNCRGAAPEHIVRLTWYVVDMDEYGASRSQLRDAYSAVMGAHFPAMALVEVRRLVEPRARVEIEATAVIPPT